MNTLQKGVVTLIRSALTQQPYKLPDDFSIEDAAEIIRLHCIATLCYEGAALCGVPTDTPFMEELFKVYCATTIKSIRQEAAVSKLFHAFESSGIDYIPLKGCRMRPLYPKPELRNMGDADVLIRPEQYDRVVPIVRKLGYELYAQTDHDYSWTSNDLFLELHHRLMPPEEIAYTAIYEDGWLSAKPQFGSRWEFSPEDEWLYLFDHFTKHYITGVGIRQVSDLWMFLKTFPDLDKAYIERQLAKLNFGEFYTNVLSLISVWFDDAQPTEKADFMTDYIFSSGTWGTLETKEASKLAYEAEKRIPIPAMFLKRIWRFFFPKREYLEIVFPKLREHRWLYLFYAFVRPFVRITNDRLAPKRWYNILLFFSKKSLDNKQNHLAYVGLKLNR